MRPNLFVGRPVNNNNSRPNPSHHAAEPVADDGVVAGEGMLVVLQQAIQN